MPTTIETKNIDKQDERIDPGWRWSESVRPIAEVMPGLSARSRGGEVMNTGGRLRELLDDLSAAFSSDKRRPDALDEACC